MLILDAIAGSSSLVATLASAATGHVFESRLIDSRVWGSSALVSKGSGTLNFVPKWSNVTAGSVALADSQIADNGTCVAIGSGAIVSDSGSGVELAPALWAGSPSASPGRWSHVGGLLGGLPLFSASQTTWGHSANVLAKWKARGGLLTVTSSSVGVTLYDGDAVVNGVDGSLAPESQSQAAGFSTIMSSGVTTGTIITYDFDTYLAGTAYKKLHYRPTALESFRPVVAWYPTGIGVPTNIKVTVSYSSDGSATNSTVFLDTVVFDGVPQFKGQYIWVGPGSVVGNSSNAWIRRVKFEFTLPTTTVGEQSRILYLGLVSNLEQSLHVPSILTRNRWASDQVFVNSAGVRFEPTTSTGPWDSRVAIDANSNNLRVRASLSGGKLLLGWDKSGSVTSVISGGYESSSHRFRPASLTEDVQLGDSTYRWNGVYSKGVLDVQRGVGGTFANFLTTGAYPVLTLVDSGLTFGSGSAAPDSTFYRSGIGALKTDGSLEALGLLKASTIQSTVATGTAPMTVASTTVVTNLNADRLDGNDSSYFDNRDITAISTSAGVISLTRTTGNLTAVIDDSLILSSVEGNASTSILGAFLNNALVNCISQQGATLTTSTTGGVSLTSAQTTFTPSDPGVREFCQIQTTNGGTAVIQITGLTLQTAAHGYWEAFTTLRYSHYASAISNVLIEIRDSSGAWVTWHNAAGTWRNSVLRTGHIALTNYPPNGIRFTFTFNTVSTIYIAELGLWHRNYVQGRHLYPQVGFVNKFTAQNRFTGSLVVDSSNFGTVSGSTQLLVGSELQAGASSIMQVGGNARVGSLTTHGAILPNANGTVNVGSGALRFGTVYANTIDAATSVTVGGSMMATQAWATSQFFLKSGGQITGIPELAFATPRLAFYDPLPNAGSRRFDLVVESSTFNLRAYNDDRTWASTFISAAQTNGTAVSLDFTASSVRVNGSDIATESWVLGKDYVSSSWVSSQGYATQAWVNAQTFATQTWVNGQNYATHAWSSASFAALNHTHYRSAINDFAHASSHAPTGSDALPWTTIHARGSTAGRATASAANAGYYYSNTSTGTLQWSDGSSWIDVAVASTGGTGTVTSVALTAPSELFAVSGSPVTSDGILGLSFQTKTSNLVFASPSSGTGLPVFRALVSADIPALAYLSTTSGGTVSGSTTFSSSLSIKAAATSSVATHIPVFLSSPDGSSVSVYSRTAAQLRSDIGADNAGNLSSGTIPSARLVGTYDGITALGFLSSLAVSGTVTASNLGTSNQTIEHVICRHGVSNQLFNATNSHFKTWLAIAQSDVTGLVTALAGKTPEPTSDGYWVRRKNGATLSWESSTTFAEPESDGLYSRRKSGSAYSWEAIPDLPIAPTVDGPYVLVCASGVLSWRKLVGDGVNIS